MSILTSASGRRRPNRARQAVHRVLQSAPAALQAVGGMAGGFAPAAVKVPPRSRFSSGGNPDHCRAFAWVPFWGRYQPRKFPCCNRWRPGGSLILLGRLARETVRCSFSLTQVKQKDHGLKLRAHHQQSPSWQRHANN